VVEPTEYQRGDGGSIEIWRGGSIVWPEPTSQFVPDYPGQPEHGMLVGVANSNSTTEIRDRYDIPLGVSVEIHRSYFQWSHIPATLGSSTWLTTTSNDAIANGRLPYISVKPPGNASGWDNVAAGQYDNNIDQLLNWCASKEVPIWLAVHHEPEEEKSATNLPSNFVAMNARVRERMDALNVDNVSLQVSLMGWTWDTRSNRFPDEWWDPDVFDCVSIDPYICYPNHSGCWNNNLVDDLGYPTSQDVWTVMHNWIAGWGVDMNIAEWGQRIGTDGGAARMRYVYDVCNSYMGQVGQVKSFIYFDADVSATQGPEHNFLLEGPMFQEFKDILLEEIARKQ
jgi:hypothetical protein